MSIIQRERETYSAMWALDAYHEKSPGELLLPLFLDMAQPQPGAAILDAGCGAGKGALALAAQGFNVTLCDIADVRLPEAMKVGCFSEGALWEDLTHKSAAWPGAFDYVYCCDVLEHIPPTFTMLVISRLLEAAPRVFLSISLMPDNFGVWIGKTLHQTVQSFPQWRDQLNTVGRVVECRDLLHTGVFLVERR